MAGSMSQADLVADLKRSLHDAATVFDDAPEADADFKRFLSIALTGMQAKRPRTLLGTVQLQADVDRYPIEPADFAQYKTHQWGGRPVRPWLPCYPGALPRISAVNEGDTWSLIFDPAPTSLHLDAYGSTFRYWYYGKHSADDTGSTLAAADRPLLILRAQAEAMREMAMRNINKPVQLRDGISGAPRNSTPAALYRELLSEWEAAR